MVELQENHASPMQEPMVEYARSHMPAMLGPIRVQYERMPCAMNTATNGRITRKPPMLGPMIEMHQSYQQC